MGITSGILPFHLSDWIKNFGIIIIIIIIIILRDSMIIIESIPPF